MPSIKVLPDTLINKIAAGEVVERPASVVKELIENSLDAGATEVIVDIEGAGKRLIRVADDGSGMTPEDASLAFERHATSKISSEEDLDAISTMGFRGEALASIAAVAQVRLLTCRQGEASGVAVEVHGGAMREPAAAASPAGTTIEVGHLFYNIPARLKFLKSAATELSHIIAAVSRQAMARPDVRFRLTHDRKTILDLPHAAGLRDRAFQLMGPDLSSSLFEVRGKREPAQVFGLAGKPGYSRGDRSHQEFYVNGRYVRSAFLTHALYDAYRDLLMRDRHPAAYLFIDIDPALVDVNVHPAKLEVRFREQSQVHDLVRDLLREALRSAQGAVPDEHAGRVQEAVSDYMKNAECGMRNAELKEVSAGHLQREKRTEGQLASSSGSLALHSAHRTPHSALLLPLAQVHDSFIVAQDNEDMALIDQHAAHERVLFEKLQDQHAAGRIPVQDLLLPVPVEPGPADAALLSEHLPALRTLGLQVEKFGGGTFMIKGVPALMTGGDHARLLADILDELRAHGRESRMERMRDELLSVMACHPAVKVHRKLSLREMEELIRDLFACRMPHSCPHGRPTVVRFPMDEIRRMFKRQ